MTTIDLTNFSFSSDRAELRTQIINHFLKEEPGTGKGENTTRYSYIVRRVGETEVFLKRPAQFNNGFDFTVNVSNINFNPNGRPTSRPTHQNIFDDLELKKDSNEELYLELCANVQRIYSCQKPLNENLNFDVGLNTAVLLECIKWLFVEQDVTYWNFSGRAMFYQGILEI